MHDDEVLRKRIAAQARRLARAERDRPTLMAQTVFLGTLALLFVLPLVAGAYAGRWLDGFASGYSYRWTMGGIGAGLALGVVNVALYLRRHGAR